MVKAVVKYNIRIKYGRDDYMPRRGENIYKRNDGRWEARYVKEILPDGSKRYGSVYASTYNEVKAKQQYCIIHPKKSYHNSFHIIISVLALEWLDSIKNNVKINTYKKYKSLCNKYIIADIGNVLVRLLSSNNIRSFTNRLISYNLSYQTINDILVILNLILKFGESEYQIAPVKINYLKIEKHEMRVLSKSEQKKLTDYLTKDNDIYKFGVLLTLYTGIRIGELCALTWDDITDDYIVINKTMYRTKGDNNKTEIKIGSTKTVSSNRKIPLPQCLLPYVTQYRNNGYVLSTEKQQFCEPRLMQLKFAKMIKECKIEKANFHALRHTFATRCVEAGVDVKTLSEMLGHSDVKTTLNKYVHSSFELKQQSMKQLELSLIS